LAVEIAALLIVAADAAATHHAGVAVVANAAPVEVAAAIVGNIADATRAYARADGYRAHASQPRDVTAKHWHRTTSTELGSALRRSCVAELGCRAIGVEDAAAGCNADMRISRAKFAAAHGAGVAAGAAALAGSITALAIVTAHATSAHTACVLRIARTVAVEIAAAFVTFVAYASSANRERNSRRAQTFERWHMLRNRRDRLARGELRRAGVRHRQAIVGARAVSVDAATACAYARVRERRALFGSA
jgi:hypothetical protein